VGNRVEFGRSVFFRAGHGGSMATLLEDRNY
jgi:hypothetical protein